MTYSFAAERQLIFYANVKGRSRLIQFGERNHAGSSVYMTQDSDTADSIRKNSMFRRGVIKETTVKGEKNEDAVTMSQKRGQAKKENSKAVTESQQSGQAKTDAGNDKKIVFPDFSHAREWFATKFNADRQEIKTPILLAKFAKEHGVKFEYQKK